MDDSARPQDEILVAVRQRCAMVKVNGRGSFKAGPSLKRFGAAVVDKGCTQIIFDMEQCLAMDSTFMGVLAGLALRLQRASDDGRVVAMNLTPKTASLLETLGLDRLVECYQAGNLPDKLRVCLNNLLELENLAADGEDEKRDSLETMLEAHQDLVEAAPENLTRFRDVIAYLDQDLKELNS
jgi:anti-sigma B factor antagonist